MKHYYSASVLLTLLLLSNLILADDKDFSIGMKPTLYLFNTDETNEVGMGVTYLMGFRNHDNISFRAELGLGNAIYDADEYNTDQNMEADYIGGYVVFEEGNDWAKIFGKIGINSLSLSHDNTNNGNLLETTSSTNLGFGAGVGLKATQSFSIEAELNFISSELITTGLGLFYVF